MVKPFWRKGSGMDRSKIIPKNNDGLTWYKDLGLHAFGEFSMAMTQANTVMEDQCQIESGPLTFNNPSLQGTFVGVYDGHGGPEASRFIADNIFTNLKKFASQDREISENVIKKAYAETDEDFLIAVKKQWRKNPQMASVGSCCLTGVICNGLMYIANAGDSRAVLGRTERDYEGVIIKAVQLSEEHNANVEEARQELWSMHPNDPNILVMKHRTWRVKGVIQVTRSMGDAYLKKAEFNREPLLPKFRLEEHFDKPILSAEPSVTVTRLSSEDEFIILASDGLWEQLSNQEAVDIVYKSPRQGIARRLIKAALKEAAKKREMRYSDLKEINTGVRRHFHDDITVIVVYLKPLNG